MRYSRLTTLAVLVAACGMEVEAGDVPDTARPRALDATASANAAPAALPAAEGVSALLYSDRDAQLAARIDGVVEEVLVELGDMVKAGQVLARLDDGREAARRRSAAAATELARTEHARTEQLHEKGLITTAEYESSLYRLRSAEAELQSVEVELGYTRITAPFAGVVTSRMTGIGRAVAEGEPLFRLTALRPLRALVRLTERQARTVAAGTAVTLLHADGMAADGRVERISPAVDPASGTVELLISVREPGALRPGSMVRVYLDGSVQ